MIGLCPTRALLVSRSKPVYPTKVATGTTQSPSHNQIDYHLYSSL